MVIQGRAWKLGDNIDTDLIIPGKYLHISNIQELAEHTFEGIWPGFCRQVIPGDIIVAGRNFGCGSSRESAVGVLKELGIGGVVAVSFARIFFRNAINIGLPVLEVPSVTAIAEGDEISVDLRRGMVTDLKNREIIVGSPLPEFILEIIACGGLVNYKNKEK